MLPIDSYEMLNVCPPQPSKHFYSVEIIQLVEVPHPLLGDKSANDDSSLSCQDCDYDGDSYSSPYSSSSASGSSSYSDSSSSSSRVSGSRTSHIRNEEHQVEVEAVCSSYCSSDMPPDASAGSAATSGPSYIDDEPSHSIRMARILAWRDNTFFPSSPAPTNSPTPNQPSPCIESALKRSLKRKVGDPLSEVSDDESSGSTSSHSSKRSRSHERELERGQIPSVVLAANGCDNNNVNVNGVSTFYDSQALVGSQLSHLRANSDPKDTDVSMQDANLLSTAYPCPACDSFFSSRQALGLHGCAPGVNEACRIAVAYVFE